MLPTRPSEAKTLSLPSGHLIATFRTSIRDVAEHIDEYAVDHPKRHALDVSRNQLQVAAWDGTILASGLLRDPLTEEMRVLDADVALGAAERIALAVRSARDRAACARIER